MVGLRMAHCAKGSQCQATCCALFKEFLVINFYYKVTCRHLWLVVALNVFCSDYLKHLPEGHIDIDNTKGTI